MKFSISRAASLRKVWPDSFRKAGLRTLAPGLRRLVTPVLSALLALVPMANAMANYPVRPVTLIVPYVPGGQGDVFARLIAEKLSLRLKQNFIVENRPGATGAVGSRMVAHAPPDGYTLLLGQTGEIAVNGFVVKSLGYDPVRDFKPVILIADGPLVLLVPANSPFHTMQDLLTSARVNPGGLSYASSGAATPGHLAGAALALGTHTQMVHVPYKGGGQALSDLVGGHVQFFFSSAAPAMSQIAGGKLRPLAVSSSRRLASLPNVPTVAESTLPGFSFSLWGGVFAPAGTPEDVVNLLNREIAAILAEPTLKARFESDGNVVRNNTPAQFADFIAREISKYSTVIKAIGLQPE